MAMAARARMNLGDLWQDETEGMTGRNP